MTTLCRYIAGHMATPFRPGVHDCARFAAEWVRLRTGKDLAEGWAYESLPEGMNLLRARGFDALGDLAAEHLPEVPPLMAQRGDVALVDGEAFGIVGGDVVHVLQPRGLAVVSLSRATRAFRVS